MNTTSTQALIRCPPDHPEAIGFRLYFRPDCSRTWQRAPWVMPVMLGDGDQMKSVECGAGVTADYYGRFVDSDQ